MCNRYTLSTNESDLAEAFDVRFPEDFSEPGSEMYPKRPGLVLRRGVEPLVPDVLSWGLPSFAPGKPPITNVRNLDSPHWRKLLIDPAHRCLVPVSRFCEWSGEKGSKVEHWFVLRDRPLFAFAGLYTSSAMGADEIGSYGFLTCDPNPLVAEVHPKAMPVILHAEDHDRWLDGDMDNVRELAAPFPSQLMTLRQ